MSKLFVIGIGTIVAIGGGLLFFSQQKSRTEVEPSPQAGISRQAPTSYVREEIDSRASFVIFTNGTFRIFTAPTYHNLSEDVFIQVSNPNVIHVKKTGITWSRFFATLPFKLTKDCLTTGTKQTFCTNETGALKFYLNGTRDDSALEKEIFDGDTLLVSYGPVQDKEIPTQIEKVNVVGR